MSKYIVLYVEITIAAAVFATSNGISSSIYTFLVIVHICLVGHISCFEEKLKLKEV